MIKWPGRVAPRASNQMFSVHDWFPTLAGIIGAKVPTDRNIDGVDQRPFLTGKQERSNRESLTALGAQQRRASASLAEFYARSPLYGFKESVFDGAWTLPDLELVK